MKCTSKKLSICMLLIILVTVLGGCANKQVLMQYDYEYPVTSYKIVPTDQSEKAVSFAADLCVSEADYSEGTAVKMDNAIAAGLFNLATGETMYAKNIHTKLNPASLTKVMTAIVALKYGEMDKVITVSKTINDLPYGASTCGLKVGDKLTLSQALHALLICSGNDAAIAIAEAIAGSIEEFAVLMNEEAMRIGATNSYFLNPHGLTENNHLVTVYDMYLIFNEAIKYDTFTQIIAMPSYETQYYDKKDKVKEMKIKTTNQYLTNAYGEPDKVTVIGGKTGTTNAAGQCLVILSKDIFGNSYISVILGASERALLYSQMTSLLDEIYN